MQKILHCALFQIFHQSTFLPPSYASLPQYCYQAACMHKINCSAPELNKNCENQSFTITIVSTHFTCIQFMLHS